MYENSSCSTTNWNVVVCTVQLDCSFWYCQFFLPFLSIFFSFHLVLSHPIPFIFLSFWHCFFSFCYSNRHIVVSYCDFNVSLMTSIIEHLTDFKKIQLTLNVKVKNVLMRECFNVSSQRLKNLPNPPFLCQKTLQSFLGLLLWSASSVNLLPISQWGHI